MGGCGLLLWKEAHRYVHFRGELNENNRHPNSLLSTPQPVQRVLMVYLSGVSPGAPRPVAGCPPSRAPVTVCCLLFRRRRVPFLNVPHATQAIGASGTVVVFRAGGCPQLRGCCGGLGGGGL